MELPVLRGASRYGSRSRQVSRRVFLSRSVSSQNHLHLREELTTRPPNITYDYLSPTPSHLLNISLRDFLPESCDPPNFKRDQIELLPLARASTASERSVLPLGHHLVYFSPQVSEGELLSDGTDTLQFPGPPFVRRMWAGGSVVFNGSKSSQLHLDNTRAACIERVSDVTVKGPEEDEKIFVKIQRLYRHTNEAADRLEQGESGAQHGSTEDTDTAAVIEHRDLVFMRNKSAAANLEAAKSRRIVKRLLTIPNILQ